MSEISVGAILGRTARLMRANAGLCGTVVLLLTAVSVTLDAVAANAESRPTFIDSLAAFAAQYYLTRRLIDQRWAAGERSGALPVFVLQLVSTLGILLGLVLLVIPGLYLLTRWFAAVPLLISRNQGTGDALRESWLSTEGHGLAVFGAMVIVYIPLLLSLVVAFLFDEALIGGFGAIGVATNFMISLAMVAGWCAAIGYCELRGGDRHTLEEVFA
ncbi:glycerophosphoryl diester phosphodiesterase membrane domain-containing protein [Sphingosinicella sp. BN140058]|uniref:glycerophosphoryl diester phosphodiesterase membrane domain-containing protein n=1 Tax=Sphingosinicella sp. BN140058 TaxID=1892855 RepID=UPI0013ED5835|nr:glycerophosphoryl diester phosphodiesterase membrane domain-containing protein [Sphingosinicella sp. BN140058]